MDEAPPTDRIRPDDLSLRALTLADVEVFDELAGARRLPELRRAGAPLQGEPDPPETVLAAIVGSESIRGYLACRRRDGRALGIIVFSETEIPGVWGGVGITAAGTGPMRGLGAAAMALALDAIFTDPAVRRLQGYVAVSNLNSRRLLDRLGFVAEGLLRQMLDIGDETPSDAWLMALLRRDWPGSGAIDQGTRRPAAEAIR